MAQVYFHFSNARGVLMDRCGTSVSDVIEACEKATSRVRSVIAATNLEVGVIESCMPSMRPATRFSSCPSHSCSARDVMPSKLPSFIRFHQCLNAIATTFLRRAFVGAIRAQRHFRRRPHAILRAARGS